MGFSEIEPERIVTDVRTVLVSKNPSPHEFNTGFRVYTGLSLHGVPVIGTVHLRSDLNKISRHVEIISHVALPSSTFCNRYSLMSAYPAYAVENVTVSEFASRYVTSCGRMGLTMPPPVSTKNE